MHLRSNWLGLALLLLTTSCGESLEPQPESESGLAIDSAEEMADDPEPWRGGRRRASASGVGIEWLGRQQALDGGWAEGADAQTTATDDPYLTGLVAVTHLLGSWTHRGSGDTGKRVRRAFGFLLRHQDERGHFAPRERDATILDHVVPTVALVMTYAMTGSRIYRPRVQRALDRLTEVIRSAERLEAEVVGWSLLTLIGVRQVNREARERRDRAARHRRSTYLSSALDLDEEPFQLLETWCEVPPEADDRTRAVAALARIALDPIADAPARVEAITRDLATRRFSWDPDRGMTDPTAGIFAAIAMRFVAPSETFTRWNEGRQSAEANQVREEWGDPLLGSWNPEGLAGYEAGGRVRLTALSAAIEGLRQLPYLPWRIERDR